MQLRAIFQIVGQCFNDAFQLGTDSGPTVPGVAGNTEQPPPYSARPNDAPPYSQLRHDITTSRRASGSIATAIKVTRTWSISNFDPIVIYHKQITFLGISEPAVPDLPYFHGAVFLILALIRKNY